MIGELVGLDNEEVFIRNLYLALFNILIYIYANSPGFYQEGNNDITHFPLLVL